VTLPGVFPKIGESLRRTSLPSSTGTAFVVGLAERGSTTEPIPLQAFDDFKRLCGGRTAYNGLLYDTLDVAFDRGLSQAYFVRCVGPAAVSASKKLVDSESADTLEAVATSPGEHGNSIAVEVVAGGLEGTFKLKVFVGSEVKESSTDLVDVDAAVAWAATYSTLVTLKALGSKDPKAQKVTLASGADDLNNVDADVIAEGLALFTADLGPGQVAVPGNVAEEVQLAVIAHCYEMQRNPFLDAEDTGEFSDIVAAALALRSANGARQGGMFDPWDVAKGLAPGTTRTVPPVARQLGAVAAVDAQTGNASEPAGGDNGKAREGGLVIGLARSRSPEEREALNDAGVNVSIMEDGVPTTYGWRTLADPVTQQGWLALNSARVMTSIAHGAKAVLRRHLFKRTDAQGKRRAAAESDVRNEVMKPLFDGGALEGATEAEAFSVTVTQDTNPTDGSVAKLEAQIGAAPVEFAEQIPLTVVETS
jgi:phage tail sheath protein FI